ncbi:glycosyltransferase family 41 protein [Phenylobacterium sp.]|uniref:tetratricopeptide repeat protein n=1 Tax=Phenylobacterium sp. TaxID=1871053 RepID=UPI0027312A84|nr:glycosyltransferase family 41 protein [Phenylobacterium sp.]MDP1600740.1 tetratricopeptide repeat protein [Phenylobacterium sp.]MDP3590376.1 tetratricopeptide repeat protein [Phenylobacterium sp.]
MSIDRFAAAEAALKAGQFDEGVEMIEGELNRDPAASLQLYRNFTTMLVRRQRYDQAADWTGKAVQRFPKDIDLWNLRGVALRRLRRFPEALDALNKAGKLDPKNRSVLNNKGNVYNDMRNPAAVETFTKLVRVTPNDADLQRSLGRAYWFAGEYDKAEMRLSLAAKLRPTLVDAWLDLIGLITETKSQEEAEPVLERAVAANPIDIRLIEARAVGIRRTGATRDAEQFLLDQLKKHPNEASLHFQLGSNIADYDRVRANAAFERAIELDPKDVRYRVSLAESLGRSRHGDEAANLERAYRILVEILDQMPMTAPNLKIAYELMVRVAAFDDMEKLGSFSEVGRTWAEAGRHTALFAHLARVKTLEDRRELVEQHLIWGRKVEAVVKRRPIEHRGPRRPNGKIRVGFMSSDLRTHPVAYFALPLFQHYDRNRFEIYCYSYYQGEEDATQKQITEWVDGFRWVKDIDDRGAAQMIADDQLDMLIELGGSTHMNKLPVMGYKPAPLSASWVGYPHSAGLKEIDYLILDPYMTPEKPGLMIEKPLELPKGWYALGERAFREEPQADPVAPVERNGYVTFGTANNPYKYGKEVVGAWAKIVAGTPNSRFMFVRPEGGTPTFCANIRKVFAEEGVSPGRVIFEAVRGRHLPFYNQMDISLDAFPQTGGTTTCESLWMGVPVVAKVGDAVFERLSYSVLMNVGLGDLIARSTQEYIQIAMKLGADHAQIAELRRGMRARLKASPLADTKQFAADYFAMIEKAVKAA